MESLAAAGSWFVNALEATSLRCSSTTLVCPQNKKLDSLIWRVGKPPHIICKLTQYFYYIFIAISCLLQVNRRHDATPTTAYGTHSCIMLPPILQFHHFSASPLNSDDFRRYPMHMRLNGASKTLIRLIAGVLPISHLI